MTTAVHGTELLILILAALVVVPLTIAAGVAYIRIALHPETPAPAAPACEHESQRAARVGADPVASAWECDDCGHLTAWTADDYAFCNAQPWTPRAPEGIAPLAWLLMSRESRLAHYAA